MSKCKKRKCVHYGKACSCTSHRNIYTKYIRGLLCTGDRGTEKLQMIIKEVIEGKQIVTKGLVTIVDFEECTTEVMEDVFV